MFRPKTVFVIALSCAGIWIFGRRLYEWFMTGQLYISSRLAPSRYVTFSDDHVGFLIGVSLYVFLVFAGLLLILDAIVEE
jgi:hypothetical protein